MISSATRQLPMSYNNQVETPDATTLLALWLEEDLESLRRDRLELDARIQRAEHRLSILRGSGSRQMDGATPTGDSAVASLQDSIAASVMAEAPSQAAPQAPTHTSAEASATAPAPSPPTSPRRSIISLGLETRTYNALIKAGFTSFAQLMSMSRGEFRALQGFGAGCVTDLEAALARVNLTLPAKSQNAATNAEDAATTPAPSAPGDAPQSLRPDNVPPDSAAPEAPRTEIAATPATATPPQYETTIALHYRFGALRAESVRDALGITDTAALDLLKADTRFTAHSGGWFVRTPIEQSWIARRIIEILNGVRSIAIEPLYQAIRRVAAHKFLEHGRNMPSRSLLGIIVQELRTEGVRFDIIREIASVDAPTSDRELSGATQAILKAFDAHHRALTSAEMIPAFLEMGLTEASSHVALSTSPLVHRLERGIYGLVGRQADTRDIGLARLRRETGKLVETPAE